MSSPDSTVYESFIPVYDSVPEKWEEARPFLVEQLKKVANEFNVREIGWFLDEELLSGKFLFPGTVSESRGGTSQQFRSVFRKVVEFTSLAIGANTQAHGITVDGNFTLLSLWASATDATAMTGQPIPNGADTISYDGTNIIITVAAAWTRALAVIEYVQQL